MVFLWRRQTFLCKVSSCKVSSCKRRRSSSRGRPSSALPPQVEELLLPDASEGPLTAHIYQTPSWAQVGLGRRCEPLIFLGGWGGVSRGELLHFRSSTMLKHFQTLWGLARNTTAGKHGADIGIGIVAASTSNIDSLAPATRYIWGGTLRDL